MKVTAVMCRNEVSYVLLGFNISLKLFSLRRWLAVKVGNEPNTGSTLERFLSRFYISLIALR